MAERFTSLTNWLWPQAYPGYATEGQAYFSGPDPRQWIGDLIGGNSPNPNYGKTGDQIINEWLQTKGYSDPLSYAKATFAKADATPGYWDANERAVLKQDASGNWGVGTADYEDSGISMLGLLGTFAGAAGLGGLMSGALGGAGTLGAIDAGIPAGAGFGAADVAGGLIPEFGSLGGAAGVGAATALEPLSITGNIPGGASNMQSLWQAAQGGTNATGAGMDWFEQLMQGYNPDLGFQGLNEAGSGLTGGMGATTGGIDWSNIDKMIQNLGTNAGEAENLVTAQSIAQQAGISLSDAAKLLQQGKGLLGSGSSLASTLGKLGAAGLGAYGANQQSNALADLAKKYSDYGAPSRARFEAGMTPGFDPMSIPGYAGALDTASKGLLARLSAQNGNPFGNPGGLIEANKAIVSGTAMPAINEYLRQNANVGFGNSMNAAIPLETGAIGQQGNIYNALGYGLNTLTNPQPTLADMIKALQQGGLV